VFERFTERARQVVVLAQDEARRLRHGSIGTEHLLLGLVREEEGLAARALAALGVTADEVREQVSRIVGLGDASTAAAGQIPFTPRAKKVLELALRESLTLGHNFIGTEHVLLALGRENGGVASQILWDLGVGAENIRAAVLALLAGEPVPEQERRGPKPSARGPKAAIRVLAVPGQRDWVPALTAGVWCAVGLAVGLLLGWAIWG
jgi:ATP-dependent Clp protease ATP-binding subunit ClpC